MTKTRVLKSWVNRARHGWALTVTVLFITLLGPAAAETWQFGDQRLIRNGELPVRNLEVSAGGRAALARFRFVGRVGGISLEAVAEFPTDVDPRSITLHYDANRPDGARVALRYKNRTYSIPLHDWRLKPITAFADSDYTAIVSLFGEGPNRLKYFYIEYHPAFRDTLMGLRLLQADILLIDLDNLVNLPRNERNIQLLGPGERTPDLAASSRARKEAQDLLETHNPQSWVLTDVDRTAKVVFRDGVVRVELRPYFYFWRAQVASVADRERLARLESRQAAARRAGESTTALEAEIRNFRAELRSREPTVIAMTEIINEFDREPWILEAINPAISDAVMNVAQYAALFRAYKAKNPEGWRVFLTSMPTTVNPKVETPNQWER
jgi:hypothetical protein